MTSNGLQEGSYSEGCPICCRVGMRVFIEIAEVPVHCNILWPTRTNAIQATRGAIKLGFCEQCGHIYNLAFTPALMEYTQAYENSLHFSPRFQRYAEAVAQHLVDRYDLRDKDIIDIGCGKGDFLKLICKIGNNRGAGFDRSYVPDRDGESSSERVRFVQDFYSEAYADYSADLICCRHVLEHIQYPRDFLNTIRRSIGNRLKTAVFFEVPNALFTLRDLGIWDIIYEHCSYFSDASLTWLFSSRGFNVSDVSESYEGQFLCLEALPQEDPAEPVAARPEYLELLARHISAFSEQYKQKVEGWRHQLGDLKKPGRRAVIWGGGSKGVTFLNVLKIQDSIEYVVDINPHKQGKFVAGSGQQIVPPQFLRGYRPDVVIIMNSIYKDEIWKITRELGLAVEILTV